ncbi:hypothetical protein COO49_24395 [Klebsiella pneumoniae]|nr:hypothetical protein COO49_24395 [Klebsiella pneumoniae]
MTSLKTSIKTITYLSDIGCLEIQGASLGDITVPDSLIYPDCTVALLNRFFPSTISPCFTKSISSWSASTISPGIRI